MRRAFMGVASILACLAAVPAVAQQGQEAAEGCARRLLAPYVERLSGWTLEAIETGDGGARLSLAETGGQRTLLVGLFRNEAGLNTFQVMRGQAEDSGVDPAMRERLEGLYREIGNDPALPGCAELHASDAPSPDAVYKELDDLYRKLHGVPEGTAALGGRALLVGVVVVAVILVAAGLVIAAVRRRRVDAGAARPPAPAGTPEAPEPPADDSPRADA